MSASRRPRALHTSKSFTRLESPSDSPLTRTRASTIQGGSIPEILLPQTTEDAENENDIFAKRHDDDDDGPSGTETPSMKLPERFDELPIEIRSLTERHAICSMPPYISY